MKTETYNPIILLQICADAGWASVTWSERQNILVHIDKMEKALIALSKPEPDPYNRSEMTSYGFLAKWQKWNGDRNAALKFAREEIDVTD